MEHIRSIVGEGCAQRLGGVQSHRKSSAGVMAVEKAMKDRVDIVQSTEVNEADRKLAELGYVQAYKREFGWLSSISFAFAVSGLFASVTTTFVYPLEAGGLASAVWCWLISGAFCMCIALSVAELISAYPTSGGMYFTCKYLAPDGWVAEISWLCGWFNVLGQTVGLASTEFGVAQLLLAAVSMSTDFEYLPTNRQTVGVMAAVTAFHGALNSLNTRALERITRTYVVFHAIVLLSACIALLVVCKTKHSSRKIWTDVAIDTGWNPMGFSFILGFISASWTMTDYDALGHCAEEIEEPEKKAPWAITIALGFTYTGGWLYTIVLAYCTGDISSLLDSPVEQPAAQIFYNVLGPAGGVIFTVFACIVLSFTGMTGMQAGARTFWALARDELLPLSRIWYKINSRTQTPVNAVWLLAIFAVLITLIGLGSYTAIQAVFNSTAIALDWSYCIPIICKMFTSQEKFTPGPYYLGKAGFWINLCAVAWTSFVTVIFVLPTARPVTPDTMNYDSVILAFFALFAIVYWYAAGRRYYIGPRVKAQLMIDETPDEDVV